MTVPRWLAGVVGAIAIAAALVVAVLTLAPVAGTEWHSPAALWLLLPVAALPFQPWVTGVNRLVVPRVDAPRRTWRTALSSSPTLLMVAGLSLCVLALARPNIAHKDALVESTGLDIMLAIDTSGSMQEEDFFTSRGPASRIAVAKGVVAEFVGARPHDRLGLVVFGEEAFTHVPLTLDHQSLIDVLTTVDIGIAGSRGTAVGSAIAVAAKRLAALESKERILILLTDGRSNAGTLEPLQAAAAAAALKVKIYTVGVGATAGRGDGVDEPMMRKAASITGGRYFRASDLEALAHVYATIDELEPTTAKVSEITTYDERYRYLLLPGLALVAVSTLLSTTLFRRGP
jgi:Ca-activated chloride channel family protein